MQKIFVTGGAGYIGSQTVLLLLKQGYEVVVFDNLCNATMGNLNKIKEITAKEVKFIEGDLKDYGSIETALRENPSDAVIHFAALKSVNDSQAHPLPYYENNVGGTMNLLKAMLQNNVKNFVFSSTAAVYSNPKVIPISETEQIAPANVYGKTKAMSEKIMEDLVVNGLNSVRLRYFNVAGADPSGLIGEDLKAMGNLVPRLFAVIAGTHQLKIYGNQFPTRDGYQIRDYIHVVDLANAHLAALEYLKNHTGSEVFNLGTGKGTTVKELIDKVQQVTAKEIPFEVVAANAGEAIELSADVSKAKEVLGWQAQFNEDDIVADAWRWYSSQQ